jgi:hypothetical protein
VSIAQRLASLPKSKRCDPKCPGWFVGEYDSDGLMRIQRCDECATTRDDLDEVDDLDCATLPTRTTMRNISTTFQESYESDNGAAQVHRIARKSWHVQYLGGGCEIVTSKRAAFDLAEGRADLEPAEMSWLDEENGLLVTIIDRAPVVNAGECGWWVDAGEDIEVALAKVVDGVGSDRGGMPFYGWTLLAQCPRYEGDDQAVTVIVEAI